MPPLQHMHLAHVHSSVVQNFLCMRFLCISSRDIIKPTGWVLRVKFEVKGQGHTDKLKCSGQWSCLYTWFLNMDWMIIDQNFTTSTTNQVVWLIRFSRSGSKVKVLFLLPFYFPLPHVLLALAWLCTHFHTSYGMALPSFPLIVMHPHALRSGSGILVCP